jgi:hypothetical protein
VAGRLNRPTGAGGKPAAGAGVPAVVWGQAGRDLAELSPESPDGSPSPASGRPVHPTRASRESIKRTDGAAGLPPGHGTLGNGRPGGRLGRVRLVADGGGLENR